MRERPPSVVIIVFLALGAALLLLVGRGSSDPSPPVSVFTPDVSSSAGASPTLATEDVSGTVPAAPTKHGLGGASDTCNIAPGGTDEVVVVHGAQANQLCLASINHGWNAVTVVGSDWTQVCGMIDGETTRDEDLIEVFAKGDLKRGIKTCTGLRTGGWKPSRVWPLFDPNFTPGTPGPGLPPDYFG